MKKLFSCVMALLAAACLYATELNVYASGLKVHQTSSGATIDYMLNAPATSLNVNIYAVGSNTPAKTVDLSGTAANLTKGKHSGVAIDLSGLANGKYTWTIEAGQTTVVNALTEVTAANDKYRYYKPQDLLVDNSFESPFFGRVYINNSLNGQSDGGTDFTKAQKRGVYIYNADLTFANGESSATTGYAGNIGGDVNDCNSLKRMALDEQGNLYIASRQADNKGVYRMDPANPTADFVTVLASTAVDALEVVGTTLYTVEGVTSGKQGNIKSYSLNSIPVGSPLTTVAQGTRLRFINADCAIRSDHRGGFWGTEHRYGNISEDCSLIVHLNDESNNDYEVNMSNNASLGGLLSNADGGITYRGVIAVNPDGDMLAVASNRRAVVFSIAYDGSGVPSLTKIYETGKLGGNIDGVAFDVANNLYVASASAERFYAYATPKTAGNNVFETPAPSAEYIALPCVDQLYEIGSNQGWATNDGIAMTKVATNVFEKEFVFSSGSTVYFTFTSNLSENWNELNLYGASTNDEGISPALSPRNLVAASENSFAIASGRYKFTADLNTMKVAVEELAPVVSIAGLDGWSTTANVLVEADDHLTASKTIHLTPGMYDFKVVLNHYIWNTDHNAPASSDAEAAPTEMNRANSTGWVFDKGDGYKNTRLRVDLEGDYEFVYTFATQALSISGFPTSFTRTVSAEDADKYQTLCVPFDATVSGATVYEFDGATEVGVTINAISSDALVAGKSYLILPEGAGDIVIAAIPEGAVAGVPEDLHGLSGFYGILGANYEYVYASNNFATYVLQNDNKFHKIIGEASATITTTHAYLHIAGGIAAPALRIVMGATNIENVEVNEQAVKFIQNGQMFIKKNGIVYDMMGNIVR